MSIDERIGVEPGDDAINEILYSVSQRVANAQAEAAKGAQPSAHETDAEVSVALPPTVLLEPKLSRFVLDRHVVGITEFGSKQVVTAGVEVARQRRSDYQGKIQELWDVRSQKAREFTVRRQQAIDDITEDLFTNDPESELRADTESVHPIATVLSSAFRAAIIRSIEQELGVDSELFNNEILPDIQEQVEAARQLESDGLIRRGYNPERQTAYLLPYNMRLRDSVARQYVPVLIDRMLRREEARYGQSRAEAKPAKQVAGGKKTLFRRNKQERLDQAATGDSELVSLWKRYHGNIHQRDDLKHESLDYAVEAVDAFIQEQRDFQTRELDGHPTSERVYTTTNHVQAAREVLALYGGSEEAENVFVMRNAFSRSGVKVLLRERVGSKDGIIQTMKSAADLRLMNIPPVQIPFRDLEAMAASDVGYDDLQGTIHQVLHNQNRPLNVSYFGMFRTPTNQSVLMELKTLGADSSLSDASYRWAEIQIRKITEATHLAVMHEWEEVVALNNMVPYDEEDLQVEGVMRQTVADQQVAYIARLVEGMRNMRRRGFQPLVRTMIGSGVIQVGTERK